MGPWSHLTRAHDGSTTYVYDESAGAGTCAYVIDTGIDVNHPEFEGRATWLVNFGDDEDTDGYGHGTHVAGTIGSKSYGVAKKTSLFAVKVLDRNGSGTTATMIAGLDFVVSDAATRNCPNGSVANMSLRDTPSEALNAAAAALVTNNVFLAVSAGNANRDTSSQSPAAEPTVCTIGATDINDVRSTFSNFGPGVDVFAPGTNILSTLPNNATGFNSGTSMATPMLPAWLLTSLVLKASPVRMLSAHASRTLLLLIS
uniref:Peptidase S8/S53 domain-containing protein n=1 Tax=Bionectria ochroleuca TaxID=29856 RepID=A0A8H7N6A2_BIOOC